MFPCHTLLLKGPIKNLHDCDYQRNISKFVGEMRYKKFISVPYNLYIIHVSHELCGNLSLHRFRNFWHEEKLPFALPPFHIQEGEKGKHLHLLDSFFKCWQWLRLGQDKAGSEELSPRLPM